MPSGGKIKNKMNICIRSFKRMCSQVKKSGIIKIRAILLITVIAGMLILALISILHASGLVDLTYKGKTLGDVVFKHSTHAVAQKLLCKDCHIGIFQMKQGTSGITNEANTKGEYCGKCHNGERAFSVKTESECSRCHQPKS
jgi:c(7)-type cytochrome triheme protein